MLTEVTAQHNQFVLIVVQVGRGFLVRARKDVGVQGRWGVLGSFCDGLSIEGAFWGGGGGNLRGEGNLNRPWKRIGSCCVYPG